jgi:pimeloyl-ACP methyl ester carboxylesterase
MHEIPGWTNFLRRLAAFVRIVTFDRRGRVHSDRMPEVPLLEERMDDVSAIMAAIGSKRAMLVGISEGAPMSALLRQPILRVFLILCYGAVWRDQIDVCFNDTSSPR